MPLLAIAPLLVSLFSGLFTFLSLYISKKVAISIAIAAVFLAITTIFYITIKLLIVGVVSIIPNQYLVMYFYALWPSNAETCFTSIFAADVAAFLYRHKIMTVRAIASS
jgi:hypothetical protein